MPELAAVQNIDAIIRADIQCPASDRPGGAHEPMSELDPEGQGIVKSPCSSILQGNSSASGVPPRVECPKTSSIRTQGN